MKEGYFSKILLKYRKRISLFENLQAYNFTKKITLSQLFLRDFPYFFIFSNATHLIGCFRASAFACSFNTNKKKTVNENEQLPS